MRAWRKNTTIWSFMWLKKQGLLFRQIRFSDFAYSHQSCLSLFVCMSFCVKACCWIAKVLKNHLYGFQHFQSNGTSHVLLLDLTFTYKVKTFGILLFCEYLANGKRYSKHYYCHQIGSIYHRISQLRMLYIVIFIYISRSQNFWKSCNI